MLAYSWITQLDDQERGKASDAACSVPHALGGGAGCLLPPRASLAARDGDRDAPGVASLFRKLTRRQGLVHSANEVEVRPGAEDTCSPIHSACTFEQLGLKPLLLEGVYASGYTSPSKIQAIGLPILMVNPPRNLIAQSQSGTGKTATFVLAFLNRVDVTQDFPQVLCLSPTYELALQTGEVVAQMARYIPNIKIRYAVRGAPVERGERVNSHVVIGTPGKVLDWAFRYKLFDLAKINMFVLDEADIMIANQGHQDQTYRIHCRLHSTCQMMFFSATYDDKVMEFANNIVPGATVIRLKREDETLGNIKQCYVYCGTDAEKYRALVNIYGVLSVGQAIIFCHTRVGASLLEARMRADGHAVSLLSGELCIEERLRVIDLFRAGKYKVLISTNVLSRGIDVEQTTLVVNWDLPLEVDKSANCETYLHRIGRTGRFGKQGVAVNLVDGEASFLVMRQIEDHFRTVISKLDVFDAEAIEQLNM